MGRLHPAKLITYFSFYRIIVVCWLFGQGYRVFDHIVFTTMFQLRFGAADLLPGVDAADTVASLIDLVVNFSAAKVRKFSFVWLQ